MRSCIYPVIYMYMYTASLVLTLISSGGYRSQASYIQCTKSLNGLTLSYSISCMCMIHEACTVDYPSTHLVSSHAHFLREEGTLWALWVAVAVVVDRMGTGVNPSTGMGAGRGAGPTRDRRIDHLCTTMTGKLLIACTCIMCV